MYGYKAVLDGGEVRGYARSDGAFVPIVPDGASPNGDYELFKVERAAGATVLPADPEPPSPPSRDERLLAAVDEAKTAVAGGAFTEQQVITLQAVFDGLGAAITGDATP